MVYWWDCASWMHVPIPRELKRDCPARVLMPVLLVLTVLATQEVLRLARAAGIRPVAWTIYAGNLLLVVAQWLPEVNLYLLRSVPRARVR